MERSDRVCTAHRLLPRCEDDDDTSTGLFSNTSVAVPSHFRVSVASSASCNVYGVLTVANQFLLLRIKCSRRDFFQRISLLRDSYLSFRGHRLNDLPLFPS